MLTSCGASPIHLQFENIIFLRDNDGPFVIVLGSVLVGVAVLWFVLYGNVPFKNSQYIPDQSWIV